MQKQADITLRENVFHLSGELDFSNVMSVYQKTLTQLEVLPEFIFDFSELITSNSAGLALVLEWVKYAKQHAKKIKFQHLSPKLLAIAKAASLENFLK